MRASWVIRSAAVAAAGFLLLLGSARPALANTTIEINDGNVPATANGFADHECDANFGGGPLAGMDVWVFVLPRPQQQGEFVSVTATFTDTQGMHHVLAIPADGGAIVDDKGTSKAWIRTPAGWTLQSATAVITATIDPADGSFNLTHTCPGAGSPSPSPSGSASGSPSASASTSPTASVSATPSASQSRSPAPSGSTTGGLVPSGGVSTGGGGSAVSMSGVLLGGAALLGTLAGMGILARIRRRRDLA